MDYSSDTGSDLAMSKRILFASVLGLAAVKIVSACFHSYQLYEVDRLVRHISHQAESEKKRRRERLYSATPVSAVPTVNVSPSLTSSTLAPPIEALDDAPIKRQTHALSSSNGKAEAPAGVHTGLTMSPTALTSVKDDHDSSQDISACSHGISTSAAHHYAHLTLASPSNSSTLRRAPLHAPVSPGPSPQPTLRNTSGICITAVHLVRGEPSPSTSQLISRLSMAGARSFSSPSPAADREEVDAGSSASLMDCDAPSTQSFVEEADMHEGNGASATAAAAAAVAATHGATFASEVHEVEASTQWKEFDMPPPPVIYYEGEVPPACVDGAAVTDEVAFPSSTEPLAHAEEEGAQEETQAESPLPYFSFTTTSVHLAKTDLKGEEEASAAAAAEKEAAAHNSSADPEATSRAALPCSTANATYVSIPAGLPRASAYVPTTEVGARSASVVSATSSTLAFPRSMVHLFVQPRWALAPSLSPDCTKWETFLRLHHISYTVHEVHVLRSDHPQAQSTDVPQQLQHEVERRQQQQQHDGAEGEDAAVTEARAFVSVLTETGAIQRAWRRVRMGLRSILPAGVLPGDVRAQYSLPFIMVGGEVLKGSFHDVAAELARRGLMRRSFTSPAAACIAQRGETDGDGADAGAAPPSSPYTPEEQRAIGQAVERTAEYTLRLLYEVGLLLEGSAVFSHYAAQLWSGHRYWDLFQLRRWFVYAWLAIPFLSALKADVEKGLLAHELGGLTREQLYRSLQSDLVSLEQLLVASAETTTTTMSTGETAEGSLEVHFLLGREPGPQDCALYAYLLPITRLTPRDIARIGNPNFTYVYESRIFRGFVARMSREAFPDLDVLLRPPRKPSFVMALSNVMWDYMEARATPGLVALRVHLDRLSASVYGSLRPCQRALTRGLHSVLASAPAQQTRLLVRRVTGSWQHLIPARPVPPTVSPTTPAPQTRRQCRQAWWLFLDLSRMSRQVERSEAKEDVRVCAEKTAAVRRGDDDDARSSVATCKLEGDSLRERESVAAEAPLPSSPVVAAPPQPSLRVSSGTQVTESLEELAVAALSQPVVKHKAESREKEERQEEVVRMVTPTPPPTLTIEEAATTAATSMDAAEEDAEKTLEVVASPLVSARAVEADTTVEMLAEAAAQDASMDDAPRPPTPSPAVTPELNLSGVITEPRGVSFTERVANKKLGEAGNEEEEEERRKDGVHAEPPVVVLVPPLPQPLTQQQQPFHPAAPVSPRVVHELIAATPARNEAALRSVDSPLSSTRSESNTIVTSATTASSTPTIARREGRIERSATTASAPSPRATPTTAVAATSHTNTANPRVTVDRVSAARAISRSLSSTVEAEQPRRSLGPRLSNGLTAAARPTTAKTGDNSMPVAQLRVPKIKKKASSTSVLEDSASDRSFSSSSMAEEEEGAAASTTSERRVSLTPTTSVARSSTTRTPTRQRRPSGLSPGLFTTVVDRKVYLTDGRDHPSWSVEPRRRTSSATETRAGRSSPAPGSRRGSLAETTGRDGARSPMANGASPNRTVTPIRKLRPSPAGRPTV